ncbi:MAG: hypothetical protein R3D85_05675 [Paracoccaceae bacterium]
MARRLPSVVSRPWSPCREYDPRKPPDLDRVRSDAALLRLDQPIPAATAAPFVLYGDAQGIDQVSIVSYGRGRSEALSWQRDCGLLGREDGLIAFDCDVTFGSSSAPVFVRGGSRPRILSLVSSGGQSGDRSVAFGLELPRRWPG